MTQNAGPLLPEDRLHPSEWVDGSPIHFGGLNRPGQVKTPVHKRKCSP
jgi:hypothetical protein